MKRNQKQKSRLRQWLNRRGGRTRKAIKRSRAADSRAAKRAAYDDTGTRDGACILFRLGECDGISEMNEHPSRAKTRGLPPRERFNTRICHRLCAWHHRKGPSNFTAGTLKLVPVMPGLGFDGDIVAEFADGRVVRIDVDRNIHYIRSAR